MEGHNDNKYNDRADEIATNFADGIKIKLRKEKIIFIIFILKCKIKFSMQFVLVLF